MAQGLTYCSNFLRKNDPDRFLLSLIAPREQQPAIAAIFAFNVEVAKTREIVTETTIGLIRLQWWRDALAEIYDQNKVLKHEIVEALAGAIQNYNLPRKDFDHILYAREFDLQGVAPASMEGLVNYADFTHTPLLHQVARCLGARPEDLSLNKAAIAYSLTGLIRAIPHHAAQRRSYLPSDLIAKYNVREQSLFDGKPDPELKAVVAEIAAEASKHLQEARIDLPFFKAMNKLTSLYLMQIHRAEYDPYAMTMRKPVPFKELRVVLSGLF